MGSMLEDVNHLSREIGARPAGTEEERLAAMYIAENIQKRSGLPFDIEDFEGAKGSKRVANVLSVVSAILMFLAVLLNVLTVPAFIITAAIAVVLVMEYFDKPVLSNFFRYGISQNVVAKYVPAYSSENASSQRKRKVVFVSRYDSGRAIPDGGDGLLKLVSIARLAALITDCVIAVFLLVKMFAFPETSGTLTLVCVILSLIFALVCVAPILIDIYKTRLLYNEGANCNASGNAVIMEIARQLGTGSYSTDEDFEKERKPVVHGKKEAVAAGAIVDGAEVTYETPSTTDTTPKQDEKPKKLDPLEEKEQSLSDAKAAVAAFMAPRKPRAQYDDEGNVVDEGIKTNADEEPKQDLSTVTIDDASAERAGVKPDTTASMPAYKIEKKEPSDVPDWFKSAQSKAKKTDEDKDAVAGKRSKFAHTMDRMAEKQQEEEDKKKKEEEKKRAQLRKQIAAANKAAEEERQAKFGDKKPFFREDGDAESTTDMPPVKEEKPEEKKEELSLDESFKKRMQDENKPKAEPKAEAKEEPKEEKKEELKPEDSGQIRLEEMQQYAPLDDQEFISSNEMPENKALTELPEVYTDENIEENPEYAKALEEDPKAAEQAPEVEDVEKGKFGTGSFAAVGESEGVAGATGTFSPVQEELIEDASKSGEIGSKEEMVVVDADDSVYNEGEFTDQGAFAGKGYVDMPDEKRKGILGLFGKKNKDGGKHASTNDGFIAATENVDESDVLDDTDWEGGAFSNIKSKFSRKNGAEEEFVEELPLDEEAQMQEAEAQDFGPVDNEDIPVTSSNKRINSMVDPIPDFDEQIQEFHNASINMEVWMVALGSEVDENAGIKAFLMEHAQELRGAVIIDVEGLGAGELSLVNSEGLLRKSKTASRLKRYVRTAANKLGMVVPSVDLSWSESSAAFANRCGFKTLRLVGMDGAKPAYYMSKNDVVENIDENKMRANVKYLLQLIQSI